MTQAPNEFTRQYAAMVGYVHQPQDALMEALSRHPKQAELAFRAKTGYCGCMDERLHQDGHIFAMRCAGCDCLYISQFDRQIEQFQQLTGCSVIGGCSHAGCGAAALVGRDAVELAQEACRVADIPYTGHVEVDPTDHHTAVGLAYIGDDLTGALDQIPGLPSMFVNSSNGFLDTADVLAEAQVGLDIAFGAHGYNDHFTAQQPFVLLAIGRSPQSTGQMAEELASLNFDPDRVVIRQTQVPAEL
jgi:hypothetical protein